MDKNSEPVIWAIKNGDLEQVKDIVEKQVGISYMHLSRCCIYSHK